MVKAQDRQYSNLPETLTARQAFAKKLEDGTYRDFFGSNVASIFSEAIEQLAEVGLAEEIGSLRVVLARLLVEENDLNRLAMNTARIVTVAVRSAQMHNEISGKNTNDVVDALTRILAEIGGDGAAGESTLD